MDDAADCCATGGRELAGADAGVTATAAAPEMLFDTGGLPGDRATSD